MPYAITILAEAADIDDLRAAAHDLTDIELTSSESFETAGEKLNFPIDADTIRVGVETLQVIGAFVSTANGLRQLLSAWSDRRKASGSSRDLPPITIADVNSGETVFAGNIIEENDVSKITSSLSESPA